MALGPVITLYNSDNTSTVDNWPVGTVKAQEPSAPLVVNIWNNKGNSAEDHSDLRDSTLTVLDASGNTALDDVARDKWIECKMGQETDDAYTRLGGMGSTLSNRKVQVNDPSIDLGTIKGTKNDGKAENSAKNVATVYFRVNAPINSTPGNKTFKIRLTGYYT